MFNPKCEEDLLLTTDETLDESDDQENRNTFIIGEETEDTCVYQVNEIGTKSSTGGWFVSEGESVLTHDDGSCSFYDIANCEVRTRTIYLCLALNFHFSLSFYRSASQVFLDTLLFIFEFSMKDFDRKQR
jgi:hypothetical protein